eukprot:5206835-Pyramimonas_sp.AAC.1
MGQLFDRPAVELVAKVPHVGFPAEADDLYVLRELPLRLPRRGDEPALRGLDQAAERLQLQAEGAHRGPELAEGAQ